MNYKKIRRCLICNNNKLKEYVNLGNQPLANNLSKNKVVEKYPLAVNYCEICFHNQLGVGINKEKLFNKYLYLSSQSKTLQEHFDKAAIKYINELKLKKNSFIADVGSNDGIALSYLTKQKYKNCIGIEPAKNIAKIANKKGIKTINGYLNKKIANIYKSKFNLVLASNVFAHNQDIKSLAKHLIQILKPNGILIIEVQYLLDMLTDTIYDNIYHEHIHYWSANSINNLFNKLNVEVFKFEKISTHGGSLRCYIKNKDNNNYKININKILKNEIKKGIFKKTLYKDFSKKIYNQKNNFLKFLSKNNNKSIYGYGAAAKTSTVLNFFKIKNSKFHVIDDNKLKQGNYIPGTNIKIISRDHVNEKIDYLIIFAWNYFSEIKKKVTIAKEIISIRKFLNK